MTSFRRLLAAAVAIALLAPSLTPGQDVVEPAATTSTSFVQFDTSYRSSPTISARLQRRFLSDVRWSAGVELRDDFADAFADRTPVAIWESLVAADGLTSGNVVDALTSIWVLNWITANGAYATEIDNEPIRQQLLQAFSRDQRFSRSTDQQRQELAEGYIFDFLLLHAELNRAVAREDRATLNRLAQASVTRFRQDMGVNLRQLVPGPNGFQPRSAAE